MATCHVYYNDDNVLVVQLTYEVPYPFTYAWKRLTKSTRQTGEIFLYTHTYKTLYIPYNSEREGEKSESNIRFL